MLALPIDDMTVSQRFWVLRVCAACECCLLKHGSSPLPAFLGRRRSSGPCSAMTALPQRGQSSGWAAQQSRRQGCWWGVQPRKPRSRLFPLSLWHG